MKLTTINRKRFRIRNKLKNSAKDGRFRISVSRSSKNISAQIIDDVKKITLISATSLKKELKIQKKNKTELSKIVAELLATKAKEKNITKIYFDRGIYKYHGRVKIFAEILATKAKEKNITKIYFDRGIYKYHGRVKIFAETLRKNGLEF